MKLNRFLLFVDDSGSSPFFISLIYFSCNKGFNMNLFALSCSALQVRKDSETIWF